MRNTRTPPPKRPKRKALRKLPTSGAEPLFSDLVYGTRRGIENNNCYAWALDHYRSSGGVKLQPGNLSRQTSDMNASSCAFLRDRALDDNMKRGIYMADPGKACRRGYYKVMAFIDKGNDYHWYKQHGHVLYRVSDGETRDTIARDLDVPLASVVSPTASPRRGDLVFVRNANVFSHKQGFATGPLLRDAARKIIPDPRRANRNYGLYNYRTPCGAMCVRNAAHADDAKLSGSEQRHLDSLLHKRIRLLESGGKNAKQRRAVRPKVQRRNVGKMKVQNVRP